VFVFISRLLLRFFAIIACLTLFSPRAGAALDVGGSLLTHDFLRDATNHFNPILPANFDLEGTWRLDPSPPHTPYPYGPYNTSVADVTHPESELGNTETEHYGVDTMTLTADGFEIVQPVLTNGLPTNSGLYTTYDTSVVSPYDSSERIFIYYYSGFLTHRMAIGCPDFFEGGGLIRTYYPPTTLFIQDVTFQLNAALELHFDLKGTLMWSDFVFSGLPTNAPAYPELPNMVIAQRQGGYQDLSEFTPYDWLEAPAQAPYLGVFQSPSGDTITFDGAGAWANSVGTNRTDPGSIFYANEAILDYVVTGIGDALAVPELGNACTYPPSPPSYTNSPPPEPPDQKRFNFDVTDFAGGNGFLTGVEMSRTFWRRVSGPAAALPTGTISGQLTDPTTHLTIVRGSVYLYLQNMGLSAPTKGESPSDYYFYVSSNSTYSAVTTVDSQGNFIFTNVPVFQAGSSSAGLLAAQYAIFASGAEANGVDQSNPIIYYQDAVVANLSPQSPPAPMRVPLLSLSDLSTKKNLATAIVNLSRSSQNYPSEENLVLGDIATYLQNNSAITPAQDEGVKRAIWGERAIQEGALDAQALFPPMLKSIATVINTVLSDTLPNTTGRGAQGKAFLTAQRKGVLSPGDLAQFKIDPNLPGDWGANLVIDGYNAEGIDLIDKMLNGLGAGIKATLTGVGMEEGKVSSISSGFITVLKTMTKALRGASGLGSKSRVPPGVDAVISYVVPLFASTLYDNGLLPFSYCSLTLQSARDDRLLMEQWTNYNPTAYLNDFQNAAGVVSNMATQVTYANQALAYITAITDTAGSSAKIFNLLGEIPGLQQFAAAGKAAELVEKLGTGASFAVPEQVIYNFLPTQVSNGVYAAFGYPPPPTDAQAKNRSSTLHFPRGNRKGAPIPSSTLSNWLTQANSQLTNQISSILSGLGSNNIGMVITQMVLMPPTLGNAVTAWDQAASRVRQTAGTSTNAALPEDALTGFAAEESSCTLLAGAFDYELIELIENIIAGTYSGKTDTNYLAAVTSAQVDGGTLLAKLQNQYSSLMGLANNFDLSGSLPIVEITLTPPISLTTGYPWATYSNEMFVMTSHVANVSAVAVSNVTLNLDIQGGTGVAVSVSATNQPSTALTLAANDGVNGSGPDEATVIWKIQYTGALDSQSAFFVLSAQENGSNAVSFTSDDVSQTLQADNSLVSNPDGIANDWMIEYFGHPNGQASDNSLPNDPAPNGDGYTILQNYELGLNPVGTNPPTLVAVPTTNVILMLSQDFVVLGPSNYTASIQVTSPGTNTAYWMATVAKSVPVALNPDSSVLATSGQSLTISLPPTYNYQSSPAVQATLQIAPAGLSSGPTQLVTLVIQGGLNAQNVVTSGPPIIIQQPVGVAAPVGSTLELSVAAQGAQPLRYQWEFNSAAIKGATSSSLTLSNAVATQSGAYRVLVSNAAGSVYSSNAQIVIYAATNGITLMTNGPGVILPGFSGTNLIDGNHYTITAAPKPNCLFVNWTGGATPAYTVLGSNLLLGFQMQSNLVLQANFMTNLFLAAVGSYHGLFAPMGEPRAQTNSGSFILTLASTRTVSGRLQLGSNAVSLSGAFDLSGAAHLDSPRRGLAPILTTLQLDVANEAVAGSVSDGTFVAQLVGNKDIFTGKEKATNLEGKYVLTMPGTANPALGPGGPSAGTATVDALGNILFSGSLADGTTFAESSVVSKDGYWPFYALLDSGQGSLWGWNVISNRAIQSAPSLSWINATNSSKSALYRGGFTNEAAQWTGVAYDSTARPVAGLTNAVIVFSGGGLPGPLTNHLTISRTGVVKVTDPAGSTHGLSIKINSSSGAITGSFIDPANAKESFKLSGVLLQNEPGGTGYFLGETQSGVFVIAR